MCGRDIALYRDYDGVAKAVEGYCSHLGANLGIGGKVGRKRKIREKLINLHKIFIN